MDRVNEEEKYLQEMLALEDLAEKKTKIYSRLLMDARLAGKMEELSARHAKRKEEIEGLLYGKPLSKSKKGGMSATNGGEEEK